MFKKQLTVNIENLDLKISKLNEKLETEEDTGKYMATMKKLEGLTDLRCKLSESKANNSVKPLIVTGLFGFGSLIAVLKFEKAEIITSKAFGMLPSLFRGGK